MRKHLTVNDKNTVLIGVHLIGFHCKAIIGTIISYHGNLHRCAVKPGTRDMSGTCSGQCSVHCTCTGCIWKPGLTRPCVLAIELSLLQRCPDYNIIEV